MAWENPWDIFRDGFSSYLFNPKTAHFTWHFYRNSSPWKLSMGGLFIVPGTLWWLVLVIWASAMSRGLRERPSAGKLLQRARTPCL